MNRLFTITLILGLLPTTSAYAQDALGDGHSLDGGLNTRGTRNDATGTTRPGQQSSELSNPNMRSSLVSNADFSAQNLASPGAFTRSGGGLTNNPIYWERAGTLQGEAMGGGYGSGLGGDVSARYFNDTGRNAGPRASYSNSSRFLDRWQNSSNRVGFGSDMSALDRLNTISNTYIPAGQPGNVLQSRGETTPEGFRMPWEYTMGGDSPFLRDAHRGALMRDDLSHREFESEPHVVGLGISPNQQMVRYTASNLRGLGAIFPGSAPVEFGLTQYDMFRVKQDELDGRGRITPGDFYKTRFAPDLMESKRLNQRRDTDRKGQESPQIENVLEQMAARYKELNPEGATDLVGRLEQDYNQIQIDIAQFQIKPRLDRMAELDEIMNDGEDETEPGPDLPLPAIPEDTLPGEVDETGEVEEQPPLNYEDVALFLRHGQRFDSLASGDRTRFDELLLGGQNKLDKGEYFWAEKRFQRALRFTPGHPLATAGLAHSQIGARLYLTAALTLKSLLGFQPEMIDVTYGPQLLPAMVDLELTITELDRRIALEEDLDDYGFLLAYLGHQLDRPELIRRGLNAMSRANQDHVFTDLLEHIWLPEVDVELPVLIKPGTGEDEAEATTPEPQPEPEPEPIELVPLIDPDTPA